MYISIKLIRKYELILLNYCVIFFFLQCKKKLNLFFPEMLETSKFLVEIDWKKIFVYIKLIGKDITVLFFLLKN